MAVYPTSGLQTYATGVADQYGIPADAFQRLFYHESRWNADAYNANGGAAGVAQLMPGTYEGHVDPYDPYASIDYAAQILKNAYNHFGNWDDAFAAYAAGSGTVSKYGGVPPADKYPITNEFVDFVMGRKSGAQSESSYGSPAIGSLEGLANPAGGNSLTKIVIWSAGLVLIVIGIRSMMKG